MNITQSDLASRWEEIRLAQPNLRIRDAAELLGVSECELLATRCGNDVTRLGGNWPDLIREFPRLGRVMCLTRNAHAVHERYGVFREIGFFGPVMGQVVGPDIDLRLFMNRWKHGFSVVDTTRTGPRRSFQFFDADGTAVHKVYTENVDDLFDGLTSAWRAEDQSDQQTVEALPPAAPEKPDAEIDLAAFHSDWLGLADTHEFFGLLKKHKVAREQALRLAPDGLAQRLDLAAPRTLLDKAASATLPIMVFIGSPGCIQIHTGPVANIRMFGEEWLNVLDDDFNMHLRLPGIVSAWRVRKPTRDGFVTSVELYDAAGECAVMFFGARKPGVREIDAWRDLADSLTGLE
jgi:putative hemin transport protein